MDIRKGEHIKPFFTIRFVMSHNAVFVGIYLKN